MPSSRLVQWSCGVAGAWLHLGSCFWVVSAKASCSSGMGRAVSVFIATPSHPFQQNKVIQLQTFTTEVLCLGFSIYPLLPLATSPKEQLRNAKCTLSVASLLRGRAC